MIQLESYKLYYVKIIILYIKRLSKLDDANIVFGSVSDFYVSCF